MKKLLFVMMLALGSLYGADSKGGFALGLGWSGYSDATPDSVDIRYGNISIDVGTGLSSANVDYYFFEPKFWSIFKFYAGLGAHVDWYGDINAGVRVPLGLAVYPFKPFEIFGEVAPGYQFITGMGYSTSYNTGFRFYF